MIDTPVPPVGGDSPWPSSASPPGPTVSTTGESLSASQLIATCGKEAGLGDEELPKFNQFVVNVMATRSELISRLIDPRRSMEDECGYPSIITPEMYEKLYERDPIASRVVDVMPRESWQAHPAVYETEDASLTTWEKRFRVVLSGLGGKKKSYFANEEGSLLWAYCKEADIKAGVNRYSIMVLGLDDSKDFDQPVVPRPGMNVRYIRVFSEHQAKILNRETNLNSERYGRPIFYEVTLDNPASLTSVDDYPGDAGPSQITKAIHWTRVVHIAEGDIYGTPRMQQVMNNILNCGKLYGGSAEMYWRGAFPGIVLETDPRLAGDVPIDTVGTKNMMERYMNGLQRYLALNGFTAKSLAPQVVDPTPQINAQLEAICIKIGIPMRIFKGSERGQLASKQDDKNWADRVRERRNGHNTPRIVIPLIDHFIFLGILPEPEQPLQVYWPDLDIQTEDDKAVVALKVAQAVGAFATQGGATVMTAYWFLTKVLGWSDAETKLNLDQVEKDLKKMAPTGTEVLAGHPITPPAPKPPTPPAVAGKGTTPTGTDGATLPSPGGKGGVAPGKRQTLVNNLRGDADSWASFKSWVTSLPPGEFPQLRSLVANGEATDDTAARFDVTRALVNFPPASYAVRKSAYDLLNILNVNETNGAAA